MLPIGCPWFTNTRVFADTHFTQPVKQAMCYIQRLSTLTAISVILLLVILLGLRYKEIVTLRLMYINLAIVWVVCLVAGLFFHLNYRITFW